MQLNKPFARISDLMELYAAPWWTHSRTREQVEQMVQHSTYLFGLLDVRQDRMIGFARVLSDSIFRGILFDVIVHPDYQGYGLGRRPMNGIIEAPCIRSLESFELYCKPEHVGLYAKFGFQPVAPGLHYLRLQKENLASQILNLKS
jgi:GNAT superfamily N-acetyltransferase